MSFTVMSELIFEGYNAPSVTYSIDSLASFYNTGHADGLVISSGTANTHVIPVINGRGILANAKRFRFFFFFYSELSHAQSAGSTQIRLGQYDGRRLSPQARPAQIPQLSHACDSSPGLGRLLLPRSSVFLLYVLTGKIDSTPRPLLYVTRLLSRGPLSF
jgi:hypothetical protein